MLGRTRYDSGVFEMPSPDSGNGSFNFKRPEEIPTKWKDGIYSVLEQESVRMKELTLTMKAELSSTSSKKEKSQEKLISDWKREMKEIMCLTHDLIECVSNDVIESMEDECFMTAADEDLEDIVEEELVENNSTADKVVKKHPHSYKDRYFIVRNRNWKDSKRGSDEVKRALKVLFNSTQKKKRDYQWDAMAINVNRRSKNQFFHNWFNRELQKRKLSKRKRTAVLLSETIESPEDIFEDWIALLKRQEPPEDPPDVNVVFWDISLDRKRMCGSRKLSEEILDLPIGDRPDIIHDRCDILEGRVSVPKFASTPRSYWNIFKSWKHTFSPIKLSKRIRKNVKKRGLITMMKIRKPSIHTIESYFDEWNWNLLEEDKEKYDDDDDNDNYLDYLQDWNELMSKSSSSIFTDGYPTITMNMSDKIKEAFRSYEEKYNLRNTYDDKVYLMDQFKKSHEEFCRLRYEVRIQRQRNRKSVLDSEDRFREWIWNIDGKMINYGKSKPIQSDDTVRQISSAKGKKASKNLNKTKKPILSKIVHANLPLAMVKSKVAKNQHHKMAKIYAKQPRSKNH